VTLLGFVFGLSFVFNFLVDIVIGQRVSAESELAGLDVPEMGAVGYPEFVLRPHHEKAPAGGLGDAAQA